MKVDACLPSVASSGRADQFCLLSSKILFRFCSVNPTQQTLLTCVNSSSVEPKMSGRVLTKPIRLRVTSSSLALVVSLYLCVCVCQSESNVV